MKTLLVKQDGTVHIVNRGRSLEVTWMHASTLRSLRRGVVTRRALRDIGAMQGVACVVIEVPSAEPDLPPHGLVRRVS